MSAIRPFVVALSVLAVGGGCERSLTGPPPTPTGLVSCYASCDASNRPPLSADSIGQRQPTGTGLAVQSSAGASTLSSNYAVAWGKPERPRRE